MNDFYPSIRFNAALKNDYRLEREVVREGLGQEKTLTVGDECYLVDLHGNLIVNVNDLQLAEVRR